MVRTNLRVEGLTVAHANRAARVEANECHNKQGDKACNDSVSEHRRNYIGNILLNKDQKNSTGVPDVHYLRVAGHFRPAMRAFPYVFSSSTFFTCSYHA